MYCCSAAGSEGTVEQLCELGVLIQLIVTDALAPFLTKATPARWCVQTMGELPSHWFEKYPALGLC